MAPSVLLPNASPYYAVSGEGCRYRDVDGNEYIDFMCGYGPVVLGYRHPEVEEAADRQRSEGDCFNHPAPVMVDVAEKFTDIIDFADWAVFAKNGSDVTTWALMLAREHTGCKKVLMVDGAYHGMQAWSTPGHGGLIEEERTHVHTFPWNDLNAFQQLIDRHRNNTAAVIVTPFHHPLFHDSELPIEGFFQHIRDRCDEHGIVLILDDIRAGFRLDLGGSHRVFWIEPDISCYGKAMGNGYPISAAVGKEFLRQAATKVYFSGSYFNAAVAMAAALTTIHVLERDKGIEGMQAAGALFCSGLRERAEKHGLQITLSGPPSIPFLSFANEENLFRSQHFTSESIARGVFLHPHHNWFMSAAHTSEDIDEALDATDAAFLSTKATFGDS